MWQENVEIIRQIYNEVSAGQWKAQPELFDPEYEVNLIDAGPDLGVIRGVEATEAALRGYTETFENFRIELLEVIHADDDYVITAVRDGGRLRGSDSEVWNRFFHVWTFRDGLSNGPLSARLQSVCKPPDQAALARSGLALESA